MKRITIIILLLCNLFLLPACNNGDKSDDNEITTDLIKNPITANSNKVLSELPVISFAKLKHDFGLLIDGEVVEYSFQYTNTGGADLVLTKVSATCGCTIPTYDRKPIHPGDTGKITVKFNSENRNGNQHKTISVLSNAQPNLVELEITANIIKP